MWYEDDIEYHSFGKAFPPNARLYPDEANLVKPETWGKTNGMFSLFLPEYAAEAYLFDLVGTSGKLTDIMVVPYQKLSQV